MTTEDVPNLVLGGGIAGVAAAYAAELAGVPAVVFEAADRPGGLLDNFTIQGFRFDTAVHLSFASEPEVRAVFDRTQFITHAPESLCWDHGVWIKHPAQNNMYPLAAEDKVELIAGLATSKLATINNYRDWLVGQYGPAIAARWPLVYTEKYWTVPAESLGVGWVGERMRRADMREVLRGAFMAAPEGTYYVKEMRYPAIGGYRAFIEPMIEAVQVRCGQRAVAVDPDAKVVTFAGGERVRYQKLVSTIPLPVLVEMIEDVPADVSEAAASLFATQLDLISVGFSRPKVSPSLWFYIYDREIWAARAYAPDWKSPDNAPAGCSSLQFEIYASRARPQTASPEQLKRNTVEALKTMGLADECDILFVDHRRLPYANVVFDLGMEARREKVLAWVRSLDIKVAGRFGEWDYLWSNQAMMSGVRAAQAAFSLGVFEPPPAGKPFSKSAPGP